MSKPDTVDYAPAVLRSLHVLVPSGTTQADLALELGLTAWMRVSGTELEDALRQMWGIRQAVLEAGDMDPGIEPIPFGGSSYRLASAESGHLPGDSRGSGRGQSGMRPRRHRRKGVGPTGTPPRRGRPRPRCGNCVPPDALTGRPRATARRLSASGWIWRHR